MKFQQIISLSIPLLVSFNAIGAEWNYSQNIDEFSDRSIYKASINANSGNAYAVARCDSTSGFDLIFSVDKFIGTNRTYPVRYRIDKSPAELSKWSVSTKGTAVFASTLDKVSLARKMLNGNKLLLEVTDFRGTPHTATYSLSGSSKTIGKVLDACGIERAEVKVKDINPAIIKRISTWKNEDVSCNKRMLASLGYSITDMGNKRTPDLYMAAQKYVDEKYSHFCGENYSIGYSNKDTCDHKDKFLMTYHIYSDAVYEDESFKDNCGN